MQNHILTIPQLGLERCQTILRLAEKLRHSKAIPRLSATVAVAFFEPSTRTRLSFELAAHRLGCQVVSFSASGSSLEKGESFADTLRTLEAMGADAIVLRHFASGAAYAAAGVLTRATLINAGDGMAEHPTQALLDARTLLDVFGSLDGKRIAIIGDCLHSRVFRSDYALFQMLGAQIGICAPPLLMPRLLQDAAVERFPDVNAALTWADAVVVLRLQRERMAAGLVPSLADYRRRYAVTLERLERSSAYVLHPGPVNPGVELDAAAVEHPRSLIVRQVANGVLIRTALLIEILAQDFVQPILCD
jgi:aspartate carbamoyltransferase catalytic subunit